MIGQPAKVLCPNDVRHALACAGRHRHGLRNRTMILVSVKVGLRAGEIAALTWADHRYHLPVSGLVKDVNSRKTPPRRAGHAVNVG